MNGQLQRAYAGLLALSVLACEVLCFLSIPENMKAHEIRVRVLGMSAGWGFIFVGFYFFSPLVLARNEVATQYVTSPVPAPTDVVRIAVCGISAVDNLGSREATAVSQELTWALQRLETEGIEIEVIGFPGVMLSGSTSTERIESAVGFAEREDVQCHLVVSGRMTSVEGESSSYRAYHVDIFRTYERRRVVDLQKFDVTRLNHENLELKRIPILTSQVSDIVKVLVGLSYFDTGKPSRAVETLRDLNQPAARLLVNSALSMMQADDCELSTTQSSFALMAIETLSFEGVESEDSELSTAILATKALALSKLSDGLSGLQAIGKVDQAINMYERALTNLAGLELPLLKGTVQINLAAAKVRRSNFEFGPKQRQLRREALRLLNNATEYFSRARFPNEYAFTQNNKAIVIVALAEVNYWYDGRHLLQDAEAAVQDALSLVDPHDHAIASADLHSVYSSVVALQAKFAGENEYEIMYEQAIESGGQALIIYEQSPCPKREAAARMNLAQTYMNFASKSTQSMKLKRLRTAENMLSYPMGYYDKKQSPDDFAMVNYRYGLCLRAIGSALPHDERVESYRQALEHLEKALEIWGEDSHPLGFALLIDHINFLRQHAGHGAADTTSVPAKLAG